MPRENRVRLATTASLAAREALQQRRVQDPLNAKFGIAEVTHMRSIASGAKQRCVNVNNDGYVNYGGRGIKFLFPSVRAFAEWVLLNIGPPPTKAHSLDRIDNNRHYEPGNLRWATAKEQNRNKRAYKRSATGDRILLLQSSRPDLTYETLRTWVNRGMSNEEILQKVKYARSCI